MTQLRQRSTAPATPRSSSADGTVEQRVVAVPVQRVNGAARSPEIDQLAVEEPLEIRLRSGPARKRTSTSVTVTMRTPGADVELAAGFLVAEGLVRSRDEVAGIRPCGPAVGPLQLRNIVRVDLRPDVDVSAARLQRNFLSSSSCGLCGKASLGALAALPSSRLPDGPVLSAATIHRLPEALRAAQDVFDRTGGLHAAALFSDAGRLLDLREDVGRHNAVDKLVGAQFLEGSLPLSERLIFVSGRAGYELVQKASAAGIPILAAVGAPSSLAVELAEKCNMTLLGFVRDGRFNIYSGGHRISAAGRRPARRPSGKSRRS